MASGGKHVTGQQTWSRSTLQLWMTYCGAAEAHLAVVECVRQVIDAGGKESVAALHSVTQRELLTIALRGTCTAHALSTGQLHVYMGSSHLSPYMTWTQSAYPNSKIMMGSGTRPRRNWGHPPVAFAQAWFSMRSL